MAAKLIKKITIVFLLFCGVGAAYADVASVSQSRPVPMPMPILTKPMANIPAAPDLAATAYILVDANSGYVVAEKNADMRLPPASITKLMTLYIAASFLKAGQLHLTDPITISSAAWHMGGSRMFVNVGSTVPLQEIIDGIVIASGNDASYALAEHIGGTEDSFVGLMNQTASALGMKNTHYANSNGLPAQDHYSTARDISKLASAWISDFPEYYPWFKQRWIAYQGIKQPNRNRLLWRDSSVDGIKTGHTDEAGYCLVSSAVRNGTRLIAVVMGTQSDEARNNESEGLLNYGFRFYETHKLFDAGATLSTPRIWFGKNKLAKLGVKNAMYVTIPIGQYQNLKASAVINDNLKAPISKGQVCGTLNILLSSKIVASSPLIALEANPRENFIFSIYDHIAKLF